MAEHITSCTNAGGMDGASGGGPDRNATNAVISSVVPTRIEEEDEILLILAEQLGQIVLSGLIPPYRSLSILLILEKLAMVEETVVRDRAVKSLACIIPLIPSSPSHIHTGSSISSAEQKEINNGTKLLIRGKEEEEAVRVCMKTGPTVLVNIVKRLATAEWFTAKVSACAVLPSVYQYLNAMPPKAVIHSSLIAAAAGNNDAASSSGNTTASSDGAATEGGTSVEETKGQLRSLYKALSEEEPPMIRRGVGKHLGRYAEAVANIPPHKEGRANEEANAKSLLSTGAKVFVLPKEDEEMVKNAVGKDGGRQGIVLEEVVPLYQALAKDEQDSVRLLAVSSSGSIGCALGLDGNVCAKVVLPIVSAGSQDSSWRVRHNLAKDFSIVAQSQGFHESAHSAHLTELFQNFSRLLQDFEAEVRTSAVENLAKMVQLGGTDLFQSLIAPVLPSLADDPVMEVRSKLAETLMDCCNTDVCSALNDEIILQEFKPLLEGFLNDEFADVQLHILSKLSRVTHLLDKMDVVVQSILAMTKAQNWRVREAVGQLFPHLAEARGVTFFEEHLLDPWMKLLMDQVAVVRLACVNGMPKLLSVSDSAWIQNTILPHYTEICSGQTSYLTRITILRSYSKLALAETGLTPDLLEEIVQNLLKALEEDPVANVRIVAAKGIGEIAAVVDSEIVTSKILPVLKGRTAEDEDADCKYFSQVAMDLFSEQS